MCNQTEFYKMLAWIMPREIHADVNAGFTLVECNREIDEREAQAGKRLTAYGIGECVKFISVEALINKCFSFN